MRGFSERSPPKRSYQVTACLTDVSSVCTNMFWRTEMSMQHLCYLHACSWQVISRHCCNQKSPLMQTQGRCVG